MRILITLLFVLTIGVITYAQVPSSFRGTLNIYQSSGTAPNFEIRGIFNDTQGVYTSDSVDVGDKVYIISDGTCTSLTVTSIISTSGGVIRVNVTDDYATLSNAPLGNAAIMEITPNQQFPTFVDGISYDLLSCIQTHFALLVDDLSFTIPPMPQAGNTQDTVVQVSHGLSLLDPVFVNTSGNWIVSNISNDDSLHMAVVTEVISADTLILTYSGITTQTAHGYTVGHVYFVQDDGSYADTVPTNLINDIAFYVVSANKLFITEQRAFTPSTDLNGIYSGSNYVPSGTIAYVDNFQIKDSLDKFIINVNPENDNMSLRGDSITMTFETDNGLVVIDQNTPKTGIRYAASGYVTNDLSLTTKEYVDDAVAGIVVHPEVTVTDGATIDFTISPLQVLTGEVISNSITASHIATGAVGSDEIATDAVGSAEIATSAVTTDEILDGTILTTDLAFTPLTGSGTLNYIPKWNGSSTMTNSSITDDGVRVSFSSPFRMQNWTTAARPASPLSGDVGWNTTNNNADIYNGSAWINYAQHSSGTGLGTSTRIPYYDANGRLTEFAGLTFNGTNQLYFAGTGSTIFSLSAAGQNFWYDAVSSGSQLIFRNNTALVLTFPISTSNGFIMWPSSGTTTNNAGILMHTGRLIGNEAHIRLMTTQNVTAGSGDYQSIHINNTITPDALNNVSGSAIGGIHIQQTYNTSSGTANQAMEYYGIKIAPSINRNAASDDNSYGILITPTLTTTTLWQGIRNVSNTGYFIHSTGTAPTFHNGSLQVGGTATLTPAAKFVITGTGTGVSPTFLSESSSGTDNFRILDNGTVEINGGSFLRQNGGSGGLRINGNDWIFYNQGNNEIARFTTVNTSTNGGLAVSGANGVSSTSYSNIRTLNATSSVTSSIYQSLTINPTSGTGAFYNFDIANTVNQTGGANGIVRDIHIHPTLTSAADYRALEINIASGKGIYQIGTSAVNKIEGNLGIGVEPLSTAQLAISASTSSEAAINIAAGSAPTTPASGDIWSDSSQKALIANQAGINQTLVGTIFTGTANATTNNTNTDISITPTGVGTLTLPANFFVAGKKLRVALNGNYTTDAVTTPTLRLKLKAGSTTIATFSANTIPTKTSNGIFTAEFVVTCRTTGVSGTVMGFGEMELNDTETTRDASWKTPATSTVTLDTTTSQALTVTAAFGTADVDNSITVTQISVEILN